MTKNMETNDNTTGASTLFANVRSKFSNFNATDFLSNLGIIRRKIVQQKNENVKLPSMADVEEVPELHNQQPFLNRESAVLNYERLHRQVSANKIVFQDSSHAANIWRPRVVHKFDSTVENDTLSEPFMKNSDGPCNFYFDDFWNNDHLNLQFNGDTLDKQHFGTFRELTTTGKRELGVGHQFEIAQLVNSTFCDKCGDFIWGLYKQAVRCVYCHYTCHYKCRELVNLDCRSITETAIAGNDLNATAFENQMERSVLQNDETAMEEENPNRVSDTIIVEGIVESDGAETLDNSAIPENNEIKGELTRLIEEYNAGAEGLKMTSDERDISYRGFIQIFMNFSRPVSIVSGDKPSSIYDVLASAEESGGGTLNGQNERKTITSFFLPRNTMKILHIDSRTTTRQLISSLLRKYKVADNPKKFALYERDLEAGKTLIARLRRVADDSYPLRILLNWGSRSNRRFVLQENDTGDILWDYFEIPELENFLKILEREEQQYASQIKQKYNTYRFYLQTELRERGVLVKYSDSSVSLDRSSSEA